MRILRKIYAISAGITLLFSPSFTFAQEQSQIAITEDSYAQSGYPTASAWDNRNFYIGYDFIYDKGITRAYLKYDFASLFTLVPDKDNLLQANLSIYDYIDNGFSNRDIQIYRITSSWQESTLNWNNQPDVEYESSFLLKAPLGQKNIDITNIVKRDIEEKNSYGLAIFYENEFDPGTIFWSTSCFIAPTSPRCQDGQQPIVTIFYEATPTNLPPSKSSLISPQNNFSTNSNNINFSWEESLDPEQDPVFYQLKVSKDPQYDQQIYSSQWISQNDLEIDTSNFTDAQYFWTVISTDNTEDSNKYVISDSLIFTVDRIAPSIPVFEPLPPYNSEDFIALKWSGQIIEDSCFEISHVNTNVIYNTSDNFLKIENLDENEHCFLIRATDTTGNVSDWSLPSCIKQDYSFPVLKGFDVDNQYLSPYSSKNIADFANISYNFIEENIKDAKIVIIDQWHNDFYSYNINDKNGNVIFPPADQTIIDGKYFAYLIIFDNTDKYSKSNIIEIYVDNYPPLTPKIDIMSFKAVFNKTEVPIKIITDHETENSLLINNIPIFNWSNNPILDYTLSTNFIQGQNIIKVISKNKFGNSAIGQNLFVFDSIPPQKPSLELITSTNMLHGNIKGSDYSRAYIYNLAGLHKIINFTTSNFVLETALIGDTNYSYTVKLEDKAGNLSPQSDPASYYHSVINPNTNSLPSNQSKIEAKNSICEIKVNYEKKNAQVVNCTLESPIINKILHDKSSQEYQMSIDLSFNKEIKLIINEYDCTPKSLWNPKTWFGCLERFIKSETIYVKSTGCFEAQIDNNKQQIAQQTSNPNNLYNINLLTPTDYTGKKAKVASTVYFSYNLKNGLSINYSGKSKYSALATVPKAITNTTNGTNKPFRFPFSKHVGVTQWYGNTKYQSPHRGIDFGAKQEALYAMADGYIEKMGWETTKNKCLSGGNIMLIRHDNGYYTLFAHMENFQKANGKSWKVGDRVLRGDKVGLSGNTGLYNCKALGYHLHLETRTKSAWKSDVNPIGLIDVDWNLIPTLGYKQNPGRLTGENPHPSF